jgi:hypothetical protein
MSLLKDKIEVEIEETEIRAQKELNTLPGAVKWFLIFGFIAIIPTFYVSKSLAKGFWSKKYLQIQTSAHLSFLNPKAPIVSDITVTTQREGAYAAVLKVSNPNLDLSLDQVPYEVNFFNSNKQQIYSYADKLFLLPSQTKYVTVPTFNSQEKISYTNFHLPDTLPWQKRLEIPAINIAKSIPFYLQQLSPPAFVVSGDFTNQSPYILKKIRIIFVLYNSNDEIVGTSQRDEFAVKSFERRAFTQLWPNQNGSNVVRSDIQIYTDNLDPDNLSVPAVPTSPASDLSRPTKKLQ